MTKISDKLVKANESFTINRYDNGFMLEMSGRNKEDDYSNTKIMCNTLEELLVLVSEATNMPLDI